QSVPCQDVAQRFGLAPKLVAKLEALVTDCLAFGERNFERDLAAEPRQIVVGPRDRVDADADVQFLVHRNALSCFFSSSRGHVVSSEGPASGCKCRSLTSFGMTCRE